MPKARVERTTKTEGGFETVEFDVTERGTTKVAHVTRPANPLTSQEWYLGLSSKKEDGPTFLTNLFGTDAPEIDESPLEFMHRMLVTQLTTYARSLVYESLAAESTIFTVGKEKVDLRERALKTGGLAQIIKAVNNYRGHRAEKMLLAGIDESDEEAVKALDRSLGYGPWRTIAKILSDTAGWEYEGTKHPQMARENAASGMLEPLAT